ncbi:MAG: adenine phosphoribosyltransferase, partial [Muribaculaceae bacterium]|nr:adenine phosphoribosyltransferase [Muribaculaceae bacterium]
IRESYTKEYGTDTIEVHRDAIDENDIVVIHDDVLATGGTMLAAYRLIKSMDPKKVYINFIIDLTMLGGREKMPADVEVTTLIEY